MNDGGDDALSSFVVKGASARAHAEQSHGVQAHEHRSLLEPDRARVVLRPDVVKSGILKRGPERTRLAKAVATVGNRPEVSFRDSPQLVQQRELLVRTPGAHADSATLHQGAVHLPRGCGSIGEELKPLLAEDDVKRFASAKRKGSGVSLPPIERGSHPSCDGKHLRIQVDTDHRPTRAQALLRETSDDTRPASDIEKAVAWLEFNVLEQRLDPRPEEWAHERLLVELGKTRLREQPLFSAVSVGGLECSHLNLPPR